MARTTTHFKRLRMQLDLRQPLDAPNLPDGYRFVRWQPLVQERHAQVQWRAFRDDTDGKVFSSLGNLAGCRRLLRDTAQHAQFSPGSTWLVEFQPERDWPAVDCAMIQGLAKSGSTGAIQNVGVIPEHRGFGLGRAILLRAMHGFRMLGAKHATLEVTAINEAAVGLYRSMGFEVSRVLYRKAAVGSVVDGSERPPYVREKQVPLVG